MDGCTIDSTRKKARLSGLVEKASEYPSVDCLDPKAVTVKSSVRSNLVSHSSGKRVRAGLKVASGSGYALDSYGREPK